MPDNNSYQAHYDVVIVGSRCAGAATALLLARAGAKVLVIERQKYGSDTVSTHALMRAGVLLLQRWGLLSKIIAADTPKVLKTTFHNGDEAAVVNIKSEFGVDYLCAPRRYLLDRILTDAARDAGADIRHGVTARALQFASDGRVTGLSFKDCNRGIVTVSADIVIGADGRQSMVAKQVQSAANYEGESASAYIYGYYAGLPDDGYHWYFKNAVAAGAIPTTNNQHCVFVGMHRDRFREHFQNNLRAGFFATASANSPELRDLLIAAKLQGRLRGFVGCPGYFRQSHGPGWALVGDAGYFKDPLTAHGITDALIAAELLSGAVLGGRQADFAHYQEVRDRLGKPLFDVTNTVASFQWSLEDVKAQHQILSTAMKAETEYVAGLAAPRKMAA